VATVSTMVRKAGYASGGTHLRSLLRASLSLRERGRGHLLARLGGLSLRKEDISDLVQAK
jgi:hypothetical protein